MRKAEWQRHAACWLAWPNPERWLEDLRTIGASYEQLCDTFVKLCTAIGDGEALRVLVHGDETRQRAAAALAELDAELVSIAYGDIWLRDTAPVFVVRDGVIAAVCAEFNGWGGEYLFEHDPQVARAIAAHIGAAVIDLPLVFEGGALEVDGEGSAITTRQCALNPNRNPGAEQTDIERELRAVFGIDSVCWLDEGLINDHTHGHVDTLARFVAPRTVAFMEPAADDPNRDVLLAIKKALGGFELVPIPAPGAVTTPGGELMPASYLNFYIANTAVVVPVYGSRYDDAAVAAIAAAFPDRTTIAIDARSLLAGGGAFHCITQEQPATQP